MNATLETLLAKIPDLECLGFCVESCNQFEVFPAEIKEIKQYCIENKIPFTPFLNHEQLIEKVENENSHCNGCEYLKDRKCTIYPVRPVICRLWGNVDTMKCHFGCQPKKYLYDYEGKDILREVQAL